MGDTNPRFVTQPLAHDGRPGTSMAKVAPTIANTARAVRMLTSMPSDDSLLLEERSDGSTRYRIDKLCNASGRDLDRGYGTRWGHSGRSNLKAQQASCGFMIVKVCYRCY